MVAAVGEHGAHTYYWIAREHAVGKALDYALFNGGYVLLGNGAAHHFFGELEILLARLEAHFAVAVLAVSARLFFVLAFGKGGAQNGLFIVYLRRFQLGLGAEFGFEFFVYYVEVNFALAAYQRFARIGNLAHAEGFVLLFKPRKAGKYLVFRALDLGIYRHKQHGAGE